MFVYNLKKKKKILSIKVDNFNDTLKFNDKLIKLLKTRIVIILLTSEEALISYQEESGESLREMARRKAARFPVSQRLSKVSDGAVRQSGMFSTVDRFSNTVLCIRLKLLKH